MRCCVPGCGQRSAKGISFHTFPRKEPERAKLWIDAILSFLATSEYEKKVFTPKHGSVVCSSHFKGEDYVEVSSQRPMLKNTACPSVFLCNPNAKGRIRLQKVTSNVKTVCKIAPKPATDIMENIAATDSLLPEISSKIMNPTQKITKMQEPISNVIAVNSTTPTTSRSNDVPEDCSSCIILTQENEKLKEEILALKNLVRTLTKKIDQSQSPMDTTSHCRVEETSFSTLESRPTIISTGSGVQSSQGELRRIAELDHHYDSTPRTLKRKLLASETDKRKLMKTSRLTTKKLQRTQLKVNELKEMMKTLVQQADLDARVSKHIEEVFGSVPLEIYKRHSQSAGNKQVRRQYSPALRAFAVTLHFYSPRAYNFVRQQFDLSLPHISTIRSWYSELQGDPGLTKDSFTALEVKANEYSACEKKLYCSMMFDDMHLKKQVEWDGRRYFGFCDLGNGETEDEVEAANQVFVIMVVALDGSWKVPLGFFFHNGLSADKIADIVVQCLRRLHAIGINVPSLTFDGPRAHFSMARILGANLSVSGMQCSFPHPCDNSIPIHCLLDPCHVLKLVRGAWSEWTVFYDGDGNPIAWCYIVRLHELQEREGLRAGNKLKTIHLQWKKSPMKVNIAAQTLSSSVADAIDFCREAGIEEFQGSEATTRFIRTIDRWFDIMNSRNPMGRGFKAPLSTNNESSWRPFLHETISYIQSLRLGNGTLCVDSGKKTGFIGIIVACENIRALFDMLVLDADSHIRYLLTYKFSQDHLELFFNAVRARGGWCVNPSPRHFTSAYKRLLVRHQIKASNGNVEQMDQTSILYATRNSVVRYKDTVAQLDTLSTGLDRAFSMDHHSTDITNNPDKLDALPPSLIDLERTLEPDLDEVLSEMPPNFQTLSEFAENAIAMIAGYVVRMVFKRIKCMVCSGVLCDGEASDNRLRLILQKTNGGLILPSPDVIKICSVTEMRYRRATCGIPPTTPGFNHSLANVVFADLAGKHLFEELDDHMFDTSAEENHTFNLIKTVALCYIRIKMFHQGKNFTQQITDLGKRKKLSRLAIFLNV